MNKELNIKDKINTKWKEIAYQFDATMESTKSQIIKELERGRVGLADPLTPIECIDYITMGAKLNYSFYQMKFIDKLLEAGFIKNDNKKEFTPKDFNLLKNKILSHIEDVDRQIDWDSECGNGKIAFTLLYFNIFQLFKELEGEDEN